MAPAVGTPPEPHAHPLEIGVAIPGGGDMHNRNQKVTAVKNRIPAIIFLSLALSCNPAWAQVQTTQPGNRVMLDAHNCYPYEGHWVDRIDRALATGVPVGIEIDLIAAPGDTPGTPRILASHGGKPKGHEPTLREYFFEKVRPMVEQELKKGNDARWPILTLNINDLRTDDPSFYTTLWNLMGEYESWLCTAPKADDASRMAPIDIKPILVLTSDGAFQAKTFHDTVPAGARLRMFAAGKPEVHADNFRRWLNYSWHEVEPEGQTKGGDWSKDDAARLTALVDKAHRQGYWIRFYTLNGHNRAEVKAQGWSSSYNFGSLDAARIRWQAARMAGVDYIASDQYAECAAALKQLSDKEPKSRMP